MSSKDHRAARKGGRFQAYANGGKVGAPVTKVRDAGSAMLEATLKSNRRYIDAGMSGAQRGSAKK